LACCTPGARTPTRPIFIAEAEKIKSAISPSDYLTQKWLQALAQGDATNIFIYTGARRLYDRL
jgi:hypothetical protein